MNDSNSDTDPDSDTDVDTDADSDGGCTDVAAATGLEGADAICQEIATPVCLGRTGDDDLDVLTASIQQGTPDSGSSTCDDWTTTSAGGQPGIGHMWPRNSTTGNGASWISEHSAGGCAAGVNFSDAMGGGGGGAVGSGGGYGAIYCFAE